MPAARLDVEFIAKLVSLHDNMKGVVSPIADAVSLQQSAYKALPASPDKTIYDACSNEFFRFSHLMCLGIKLRVLKTAWNDRGVADWMYEFSKQIWAQNARRGTFGPVKFSDETQEDWSRRRKLGAKNTISRVDSLIELLQACSEVFEAMIISDNAASTIGGTQAAIDMSSLGAACGMLARRTSIIAKGQLQRTTKILNTVNSLQTRLHAIADE